MRAILHRAYRLIFFPNRIDRIHAYVIWRRNETNLRQYDTNFDLSYEELAAKLPKVKSHPTLLYIDPATMCNLKCPFCPTGNGDSGIEKELLTPENFYKIMSNLQVHKLEKICLYNWGEPLLNRHVPEFIKFFHDRGKPTYISTNFSVKEYDDEYLASLVNAGLTELDVSIDGASQETYGRYRIKGNFDRVVRNMKRLNSVKQALGSETPVVKYKMLLNKFNQHEVEEAKRIAAECGAEFYLQENFWCPEELRDEWIADSIREEYGELPPTAISMKRTELIHTECRQLWDSVLVGANGDVYPCCIVSQSSQRVGNLLKQHINRIRNNYMMKYMRTYVCDPDAAPPEFENHCEGCSVRYCTHDVAAEEPSAAPA